MFESNGSQIFQTLELLDAWMVCTIVNFMTPKLVDVHASWPKHLVVRKMVDKTFVIIEWAKVKKERV